MKNGLKSMSKVVALTIIVVHYIMAWLEEERRDQKFDAITMHQFHLVKLFESGK